MIFVDADAYIGNTVESDVHHERVVNLFELLKKKEEDFVTTWDVIDETASKLAQFATKQHSLAFLDFVFKSEVSIKFIDKTISKKALDLFKKQTSKNVSLTDCTSMVIAKDMGVTIIFSFDKHYKQNGFKLLSETVK